MPRAVGLNTYIWNNNLRCILLLALYPPLMLGLLWSIGAVMGLSYSAGVNGNNARLWPMAEAFGNGFLFNYWPLMMTIVAIWFIVSYFFHANMTRMLSRSRPVTRNEQPELYNLLENLCISRGLTMPRLEIVDTDALNAFATGIDEKSFCITVTRGLLQAMQKDELEAVLAHELTHILNRDVRLMIISIIFTGMLGFAAQLVWSNIRYSMFFGGGRGRDGRGNIVLFLMVVDLILWLGYVATVFTRFALSRRREYMADAGSVELTHNPAGMIRALQRLQGHDRIPHAPEDVALMCICNSRKFLGLFDTHPPLEDRIRAISEITGTAVEETAAPAPGKEGAFHNPWA